MVSPSQSSRRQGSGRCLEGLIALGEKAENIFAPKINRKRSWSSRYLPGRKTFCISCDPLLCPGVHCQLRCCCSSGSCWDALRFPSLLVKLQKSLCCWLPASVIGWLLLLLLEREIWPALAAGLSDDLDTSPVGFWTQREHKRKIVMITEQRAE